MVWFVQWSVVGMVVVVLGSVMLYVLVVLVVLVDFNCFQ